MLRTDTRPLTIHGNSWEYKIGRNTVAIYDPEGNRYFPKFTDIVGVKAVESKNFCLNPIVLVDYIQRIILLQKGENICQFCKRKKPDVILRIDPYAAEINGDYSRHFMCNSCADNSADDI